ncbi:hypothetical protein A5697_04925 [Mycobacterium sp. E3251]|uniref:hypothetical protein n=1 Tax=unclassified Mycobacterium TaxID=2642494 RepID=UPI0008010E18|nr:MULTISPECIES: hypothetical protein [unclassified Mycobacterium]OBG93209.1 hypothetical protein A5697_04925 [Mycobacterium sp. E3251]OBI28081.1 hypothetical protein A5709_04220 [Mycobacterium sp. E1386]
MRAEEGDETVKDYAAEGKQALGRINASRRPGYRLGDVARRFAKLWRGDHAPEDKPGSPG